MIIFQMRDVIRPFCKSLYIWMYSANIPRTNCVYIYSLFLPLSGIELMTFLLTR